VVDVFEDVKVDAEEAQTKVVDIQRKVGGLSRVLTLGEGQKPVAVDAQCVLASVPSQEDFDASVPRQEVHVVFAP
jgi:hypothetical protein